MSSNGGENMVELKSCQCCGGTGTDAEELKACPRCGLCWPLGRESCSCGADMRKVTDTVFVQRVKNTEATV